MVISAPPFELQSTESGYFRVYRTHYSLGITTDFGLCMLPDHLIEGILKYPTSYFYQKKIVDYLRGL